MARPTRLLEDRRRAPYLSPIKSPEPTMLSILTLAIAVPLGIAVILAVRENDRPETGLAIHPTQPPRVFSNLPQVEKVDIRALFRKWED